jgi:hypothetical protein
MPIRRVPLKFGAVVVAGAIGAEVVLPDFDECEEPPTLCEPEAPAPSPHVPEHSSTSVFSSMTANSLISTSSAYPGTR